jgi:hypothetical protein
MSVAAARAKAARKRRATTTRSKLSTKTRWSGRVTEHSDALDLEASIFKSGSAERVARSLKSSADRSKRRKGSPYQSAMSMLNFYINRAGRALPEQRKATLERAKAVLRRLYGR